MACFINSGLAVGCIDGTGGIKKAWILGATGATAPYITSYSVNATDEVTSIVGYGNWYPFNVARETASYSEVPTVASANGTVFYAGSLIMDFHKMESVKRAQIKLLVRSRQTFIIYQDANDLYWFVGLTRGAEVGTGNIGTGIASGDANKYSITFTTKEPESVSQLASTITALIGATGSSGFSLIAG